MLYQLESGDWIDPRKIVGVQALDESVSSLDGEVIPPRVQVRLDCKNHIDCRIVKFNTIEGARDYRDQIALLANESQQEQRI